MSITVSFATGSKRDNSTRQLTMTSSYECNFKNGCSMLNPTLLLEISSSSFPAFTAFKIENKYYTVTDIRSVRNNLFEVSGEIDVLATYKNVIGATTEYVTRSASAYDLNIADAKYPTKANTSISEIEFNTLHSSFTNGGSFVIGISNGVNEQSAGVTYYVLNNLTMARFLYFMFDGTWMTASDISTDLQKELVNPMQYIDSIKWYPFDIANSSLIGLGSGEIKFGYWGSGITAPIVNANDTVVPYAQSITIPNHSQYSRGHYLNGAPFTLLSLQCYTFGQIPIDSNIFVSNSTLTLSIAVDVMTGLARLTLRCGSDPIPFYTKYGDIGVNCKISQITQGFLESIGNVSGGGFSLIAGNPIGFASGIVSGLQSLQPQLASSGTNGSKMGYNISPRLTIKRQNLADEDIAQLGRPLCSPRVINTLSGYIQCENVDIDIAATAEEKRKIIHYMETGFFYE